MATSTTTQYQHLEPRPGSNYRQLFLKGRRIRAAVVHEAVHGPDPYTPEEFARDPEHANLKPRLDEIKRLKKLTRPVKKATPKNPAPQPAPSVPAEKQ